MSQETKDEKPEGPVVIDPGAATVVDRSGKDTVISVQAEETVIAPTVLARSSELSVGSVVKGRFVLEQRIGEGGMGVIFKARDRRKEEAMDREPYVAMKVLGEEFKHHPDALICLQREAKKAQMLAHPNIVTVYDFDRDGDSVYMTMEWLDGEPLDHLLKRLRPGHMPREQAFALIEGMGEGLAYAHKRNIVHSDFKPGNVFVTKKGDAKILDFGIARAVSRPEQPSDGTLFDAGQLGAFTPAYASCEMVEHADPDPRDDIFALACVAYELLTGEHPFGRKMATAARAAKLTPAPVLGLSRSQWQALLQGLAFERETRTPNVETFLTGLTGKHTAEVTTRKWKVIASATVLLAVMLAAGLWFLRPVSEITHMDLPPPPTAKPLNAAERQRLEERLTVGEVQLDQGREFDPWYLYDAHQAYVDAITIDPVNTAARQGLLEAVRAMRRDTQRDPAFNTWFKWLESIGTSLKVPLIASDETDVKELNALAGDALKGMISAIQGMVEAARQDRNTDSWDRCWLAIRQALELPLVAKYADGVAALHEFETQVAPHVSPELRPDLR